MYWRMYAGFAQRRWNMIVVASVAAMYPGSDIWCFILFAGAAAAGLVAMGSEREDGIHAVLATLPLSGKQLGGVLWVEAVVFFPMLCGLIQMSSLSFFDGGILLRHVSGREYLLVAYAALLSVGAASLFVIFFSGYARCIRDVRRPIRALGFAIQALKAIVALGILVFWDEILEAMMETYFGVPLVAVVLTASWKLRGGLWSVLSCKDAVFAVVVQRRVIETQFKPMRRIQARTIPWLWACASSLAFTAVMFVLIGIRAVWDVGPKSFGSLIPFFCCSALGGGAFIWISGLRVWKTLPFCNLKIALGLALFPVIFFGCTVAPVLTCHVYSAGWNWSALGAFPYLLTAFGCTLVLEAFFLHYSKVFRADGAPFAWIPVAMRMFAFIAGVAALVILSPAPVITALVLAPVLSAVAIAWLTRIVGTNSDLYRSS